MTFITEPITTLTDFTLCITALVLAFVLPRRKPSRLWRLGFLCVAAAAFLGGMYHGFAAFHTNLVWYATRVMIVASIFTMIAATTADPERNSRWLWAGLAITILGFSIQLSNARYHNDIYHVIQTVAMYFFFRGARPASWRAITEQSRSLPSSRS